MKVQDLMIGDWVLAKGKPIQVFEIIEDGINLQYDFLSGNTYTQYLIENIEPIPLTPEILEKNGFELVISGPHYGNYYYSNKLNVKLYSINNYIWGLTINRTNRIKVDVKYVHELQHALKLCGIEKEIVL